MFDHLVIVKSKPNNPDPHNKEYSINFVLFVSFSDNLISSLCLTLSVKVEKSLENNERF